MNNLFLKIKFFLKKPPMVVIVGDGRAGKIIHQVIKKHYKVGRNAFIFETVESKLKEFYFFFKNSQRSVLILLGDKMIPYRNLPRGNIYLVFNNDNERVKEANNWVNGKKISFGLNKKADVFASDLTTDDEGKVNFKINYKGSSVPFWTERLPEGEKIDQWIYPILSAICTGLVLGLNLVEISEALNKG